MSSIKPKLISLASQLNLNPLLLFFLLLTTIARLSFLNTVPSGLYVDESSIGYNAFTILHTATDEHGIRLPVFFKAFGEYKSPIFIYSIVPFLQLLGVSIFTLRFVSSVWGFVALLLFFQLSYSLTKNQTLSLLATIAFSLNPVLFTLSRVVFEVVTYPAFILASILALYHFHQHYQIKYWYLFTLISSLSIYSYSTAKFSAVVFFITAAFIYLKKIHPKPLIISVCIFVITLTPAIYWEILYPGSFFSRFHSVSLFSDPTITHPYFVVFENITKHFLPSFLFDTADGNFRHSAVWHGVYLWSIFPLLITGFLSRQKKLFRFHTFIITNFILGFIPSSLTHNAPHVLRSVNTIILGLVLANFGLLKIKSRSQKFLVPLFSTLLIIEGVLFLQYFFTDYQLKSQPWFDHDLIQADQIMTNFSPPYYYSRILGDGNYVNIKYLQATKQSPGHTIYSLKAIDFDPYQPYASSSGVFLFDHTSCYYVPSEFKQHAKQIQETSAYCLYQFN